MNPALNGPLIAAAAHRELLLPAENAFRFADRLMETRGPLASWSLRQLARPMTLQEVARHWRVGAGQVRSANPLPEAHRYRQDAALFIPRRSYSATTEEQVRDSALLTEPMLRRVVVRARAKDTLARLGNDN